MKKSSDAESEASGSSTASKPNSENGDNKKVIQALSQAKKTPLKLHFPGGQTPLTNLLVLNEVVIDRGPSPYLSNIDLYLDGKHITSVQVCRIYRAIKGKLF